MTDVLLLGLLAGVGCVGAYCGVRASRPSLEEIVQATSRPYRSRHSAGLVDRLGAVGLEASWLTRVHRHPRWIALAPAFAITGITAERLTAQVLLAVGAGVLLPPVVWALAAAGGVALPLWVPVLVVVPLVATGGCLPFCVLVSEAKERRKHCRVVIGTYVDLVVLSLAGGVGVEGSLLSAAEVSTDWAAKRIARSLLLARDTGEPAWEALEALGHELGVAELWELAATLHLAGTEGARIRHSLSARAASLRRHEQAEAEGAANAMTERLFLPGTLLLLGFLLFIGYPAISRILIGF